MSRLAATRERVREGIEAAFAREHTPGEIAASFAAGAFVAALPTAGTAIALFAVAAYLSERVSKLALLAVLVVFNPAVKWGIYAASFPVGAFLLGPVPGVSAADITASGLSLADLSALSLSAGPDVLVRQFVGNVVLAALLAGVGYAAALRLSRLYRRRDRSPDPVPGAGDVAIDPGD